MIRPKRSGMGVPKAARGDTGTPRANPPPPRGATCPEPDITHRPELQQFSRQAQRSRMAVVSKFEFPLSVESRCGAVAVGRAYLFSAPFVWRCLTGSTVAPFPHPAHRTGHADFPHPALGQDFTPSPTARRAQAGSGVRARSARKGARVDSAPPLRRLTLCLNRNHRRNRTAA